MAHDRYHCGCGRRLYWCRYCKIQHCPKCSPHPSRKAKYRGKVAVVRTGSGTKLIGLRRLAQLRGNSRGGSITATRPNPGRFTSETARKAARKVWATRWRYVPRAGIRIGRKRKNAPQVNRASLRTLYSNNPINNVWFAPEVGLWQLDTGSQTRCITERTALQRLGHLPRARKHWQPESTDTITTITTGTIRAGKRNRRK